MRKRKLIATASVSGALIATMLSNSAFAATSSNPTEVQGINLQTIISKVSPLISTAKDGTVSVHGLDSLNLPQEDVTYVKKSIAAYNKVVKAGQVDLSTHLSKQSEAEISKYTTTVKSNSISPLTSSGTCGLPYSWFHASTPESATYYYWWGDQTVLNELATSKMEGALNAIAGGEGAAAVASSFVPFLGDAGAAILGMMSGINWATAGYMQWVDNGAGDNLQYAADFVLFSISANND